ncbi:hypothetical protein H489_0114085 [Curtobacterium flaccumfaciens UCD-AKU]|nr:hypothetical protein H489_0114085 [Curtobacterium flaccumfaciens UCD-AKU]
MVVATELADGVLEVLERVERLVDAREAQVRDLVELPQGREDREADVVRVDLAGPGGAHGLLDALREDGQVAVGDRAPLARLAHTGDDLVAAERLGDAVALHDVERCGLGGREPSTAVGALSTAADGGSVVARP